MTNTDERRTNFEALTSLLAEASRAIALAREVIDQGDPRFRFIGHDVRDAEIAIGKAYKAADMYVPRMDRPGHVCHGLTLAECEQKRLDDALDAFRNAHPGAIHVHFMDRT